MRLHFVASKFLFLFQRPIKKFSMKCFLKSVIWGGLCYFSPLYSLMVFWLILPFPYIKNSWSFEFYTKYIYHLHPKIHVVICWFPGYPSSFTEDFTSWFMVLFPNPNLSFSFLSDYSTHTLIQLGPVPFTTVISSIALSSTFSLSVHHHHTLFIFFFTQLRFYGCLPLKLPWKIPQLLLPFFLCDLSL